MKFKVGDIVKVHCNNEPHNIAKIIDIETGLRVWFKLKNLECNTLFYADKNEISLLPISRTEIYKALTEEI